MNPVREANVFHVPRRFEYTGWDVFRYKFGITTKMLSMAILLITGICPSRSEDAVPQQDTKMMKMEGGTVIDDKRFFSETVNIVKKKEAGGAEGETKCMGVIFSSPVIFTSMLCEITDANKNLWTVETIKKNDSVEIAKVHDGRHVADFKKIDLAVPGLELSETISGDMPMAAPFNQNPDDDMQSVAVVFAFGDQVKACTVKILTDVPDECRKLYKGITEEHPKLALPPEPHPHLHCAVKGVERMNITLVNADDAKEMVDVDVGMPCDDSLGSPVYADRMVLGIVIGAFCGKNKVVLIQPSVKGLSLESYTEKEEPMGDEDKESTPGAAGGVNSGKGEAPDKRIPPAPVQRNPVKRVRASSTTIFNHLQVCSILIFGALAGF